MAEANTMPEKLVVEVEIRSRSIKRVDVKVNPTATIDPVKLIESVRQKVDTPNERSYAFVVALPGMAPGAVEIKSFDSNGRPLDKRLFHIEEKKDGTATLAITATAGVPWYLIGAFAHRQFAEVIGELWKSGALQVDLSKLTKPEKTDKADKAA